MGELVESDPEEYACDNENEFDYAASDSLDALSDLWDNDSDRSFMDEDE